MLQLYNSWTGYGTELLPSLLHRVRNQVESQSHWGLVTRIVYRVSKLRLESRVNSFRRKANHVFVCLVWSIHTDRHSTSFIDYICVSCCLTRLLIGAGIANTPTNWRTPVKDCTKMARHLTLSSRSAFLSLKFIVGTAHTTPVSFDENLSFHQ